MALILEDCTVFDGVSDQLLHRHLLIDEGRFQAVSDVPLHADAALTIPMGGRFVMPGLIDAHFHAYGSSINIPEIGGPTVPMAQLTV